MEYLGRLCFTCKWCEIRGGEGYCHQPQVVESDSRAVAELHQGRPTGRRCAAERMCTGPDVVCGSKGHKWTPRGEAAR